MSERKPCTERVLPSSVKSGTKKSRLLMTLEIVAGINPLNLINPFSGPYVFGEGTHVQDIKCRFFFELLDYLLHIVVAPVPAGVASGVSVGVTVHLSHELQYEWAHVVADNLSSFIPFQTCKTRQSPF